MQTQNPFLDEMAKLTQADVDAIESGQTVIKTTSVTADHAHTFTFMKSAPTQSQPPPPSPSPGY
jgi:hypothetical protein